MASERQPGCLRRWLPRTPAGRSWGPAGWRWRSRWSWGASRSSGRGPAAPRAARWPRRPRRRTAGTGRWGGRAARSGRCPRWGAGSGSLAVAGRSSSKFQHHSRVGQRPAPHRRRHPLVCGSPGSLCAASPPHGTSPPHTAPPLSPARCLIVVVKWSLFSVAAGEWNKRRSTRSNPKSSGGEQRARSFSWQISSCTCGTAAAVKWTAAPIPADARLCANASSSSSSSSSILWVRCTKMFLPANDARKLCNLQIYASQEKPPIMLLWSGGPSWALHAWSCSLRVHAASSQTTPCYGGETIKRHKGGREEGGEAHLRASCSWGSPQETEVVHYHLSAAVFPCVMRTEDTLLYVTHFLHRWKQRHTSEHSKFLQVNEINTKIINGSGRNSRIRSYDKNTTV